VMDDCAATRHACSHESIFATFVMNSYRMMIA
jgi:hypothetical protein